MNKEVIQKLPVDGYDFFGYLIPGMITLGAASIGIVYYYDYDLFWLYSKIGNTNFNQYLSCFLIFVVSSYASGHLIASISSIIFDRILVEKIFDYPYKTILFESKSDRPPKHANFYRSLLFVGSIAIILLALRPLQILNVELYRLVGCFWLTLVAARWLQNIKGLPPALNLPALKIPESLFYASSRPFVLLESGVRHFMRTDRPLAAGAQQAFLRRFETVFGVKAERHLGTELYWMTNLFLMFRVPHARSMLYRWLVLYSLMRNLAGAFLLCAMIFAIAKNSAPSPSTFAVASVSSFLLCALCSIRFYYLYYNYYSKGIFRAFLAFAISERFTSTTGEESTDLH